MTETMSELRMRRTLRSAKDIILLAILIAVHIGLEKLLKKIFPNMQEETTKTLIMVILLIIAVVWMLTVKP